MPRDNFRLFDFIIVRLEKGKRLLRSVVSFRLLKTSLKRLKINSRRKAFNHFVTDLKIEGNLVE